jgi:GntR family transcriptional regulator/MocR family aminotransferase
MDLHIHLEGGDLARQIYRQIRSAIVTGPLGRGDRLPATRELARRLDVARNTVSLAYEWLVAEGLLSGRKGAGSFVEGEQVLHQRRTGIGAAIRVRSVWRTIAAPGVRSSPARYDFGVGAPDVSLFPFDTWRRLLARPIRASKLAGAYGDPAGHPKLRAAIARYVAVNRGVNAEPDDVIVTNGAQQAFDLIARVLLVPRAHVVVEEPGYPPPRLLFESYGVRVTPVRVDAEGLDVSALPDKARLVYLTPSHQFPLGVPMTPARRAALLAWAERRNAVLIEDDYDSEFRFGGRPLDTLQGLDGCGRVVYVGSFSKSLLPSLRLGFLIAPAPLRGALRAASYVGGWYCQWPAQAALASLIENGLLARHVRKMRREYAARHDRILATLTTTFAEWLDPIPCVSGIHLTATLRSRSTRVERMLRELAQETDVGFDRLSSYYAARPQAGLVLGYGAIATTDIDEGLRRLRSCFTRIAAFPSTELARSRAPDG